MTYDINDKFGCFKVSELHFRNQAGYTYTTIGCFNVSEMFLNNLFSWLKAVAALFGKIMIEIFFIVGTLTCISYLLE